ncbi:two component transcriptional regulator, LuxR family [Rubrobacter xylanophilus DSM 9941]|uniref:Two component transcriptional regulator, LuxR family n=2 Tax=Rubrobacter xylanophilus TaxID=49319 RepID=Q1AVR6_RUBXD|nr:response regulator transcription factor [Rubrobacter xylanophilus]ABG04512.1 two component transcriptional regulator, LuxR family [Rubrobacter xylanophilus DSM 9941]
MSGPVRVMIVEDQALMREGLRTLLDLEEGVEVVGEAADGVEALERLPGARPEVVLVDVRMPRMDGIQLIERLGREHPEVAAIILTTFDDDEYVFRGLRAGARGYILKDTPSEELAAAIEKVHRGEAVLDGPITLKVISELGRLSKGPAGPQPGSGGLSEREMEVLRLVASGASNREIARALYITEGTVKNHISSILRKLGFRDRTQAALYALERGWIEAP